MANERIELIKNLIDYLNTERNKDLYRNLREDGMKPSDILTDWEWVYREEDITLEDAYNSNSDREGIVLDWFNRLDCSEGVQDYGCGVQQITIIFEDEVIKISNYDIGSVVNEFINSIGTPELCELFGYYNFEGIYRHCYIYSQAKVVSSHPENIPSSGHTLDEVTDEVLSDAIWFQLDNEDLFYELNAIFNESDYDIDLHSGNWGYDRFGNVLIFDPIYVC